MLRDCLLREDLERVREEVEEEEEEDGADGGGEAAESEVGR